MSDENGKHYLECDCCGDVAAWGNDDGLFNEQQDLICGCSGMVRVNEGYDESENLAYVMVEEPCENCGPIEDDCETSWDQL